MITIYLVQKCLMNTVIMVCIDSGHKYSTKSGISPQDTMARACIWAASGLNLDSATHWHETLGISLEL